MYTIARRYRELSDILRQESQENLKHADQYELHKEAHAKLDTVKGCREQALRAARWMDWELNGIAEVDEKGRLLYDVSAPRGDDQ